MTATIRAPVATPPAGAHDGSPTRAQATRDHRAPRPPLAAYRAAVDRRRRRVASSPALGSAGDDVWRIDCGAAGGRARSGGRPHGRRRPPHGGRHDRAGRDGRLARARRGARRGCRGHHVLRRRGARGFGLRRARRELTALVAARAEGRAAARRRDASSRCRSTTVAVGDIVVVRAGEVVPGRRHVRQRRGGGRHEHAERRAAARDARARGWPVLSGTANAGAPFEVRADRPAAESAYAALVRLVEQAQAQRAPFVRMADRYAGILPAGDAAARRRRVGAQRRPGAGAGGRRRRDAVPADPGRADRVRLGAVAGRPSGRDRQGRRRRSRPSARHAPCCSTRRARSPSERPRCGRSSPRGGSTAASCCGSPRRSTRCPPTCWARRSCAPPRRRRSSSRRPTAVGEDPGQGIAGTVDGHGGGRQPRVPARRRRSRRRGRRRRAR